jgi:hypothetical protein
MWGWGDGLPPDRPRQSPTPHPAGDRRAGQAWCCSYGRSAWGPRAISLPPPPQGGAGGEPLMRRVVAGGQTGRPPATPPQGRKRWGPLGSGSWPADSAADPTAPQKQRSWVTVGEVRWQTAGRQRTRAWRTRAGTGRLGRGRGTALPRREKHGGATCDILANKSIE